MSGQWQVMRMRGGSGTISHPYMAVTPGCPDGPHPTRWCLCKPFRSEKAAAEYIAEREAD